MQSTLRLSLLLFASAALAAQVNAQGSPVLRFQAKAAEIHLGLRQLSMKCGLMGQGHAMYYQMYIRGTRSPPPTSQIDKDLSEMFACQLTFSTELLDGLSDLRARASKCKPAMAALEKIQTYSVEQFLPLHSANLSDTGDDVAQKSRRFLNGFDARFSSLSDVVARECGK